MSTAKVNQDRLNRMIQSDRLSHAFIFTGDDSQGKKEVIDWLACRLFCSQENQDKPCFHCDCCRRIMNHDFPDIHRVEPTGKTIKVEQIEGLKKQLSLSSMEGQYQLCIIEKAETMTETASNQLLKFIEEPQTPLVFILVTNNEEQLLSTIISRCQRLSFTTQYDRQATGIDAVIPYMQNEFAIDDEYVSQCLYQTASEWYQLLIAHNAMAFIFVQTTILKQIDTYKKDYPYSADAFLMMVMILAKTHYIQTKNDASRQLLNYIEEAKEKLRYHVNLQAVLEQIAYYMMKGGV